MQLSRGDVLRSLTDKGFEHREGSNHSVPIYRNRLGRKTHIRTIVSRGTRYRSLGAGLVGAMAEQCGLTTAQFVDLVECSMSQDEYDCLAAKTE